MSDQQRRSEQFDEASEFDLVDSAEDAADEDPEAYAAGEGAVPEETDPADAVEQTREVPADEDDQTRAD